MAYRVLHSLLKNTNIKRLHSNSKYNRWYTTKTIPEYPLNLRLNDTKITQLPSGLRVATQAGIGDSATVGVYIESGAAFETDSNNGISNVLQHLAWRGTRSRSRQQLGSEIEQVGATVSSYTSRERTAYVAHSLPQAVPQMVNILADVVQNTEFSNEQFEAARTAVLEEQENIKESIEDVLYDHVHTAAFQRQPLSNSVYGEQKIVKHLKPVDATKFVKTLYTAPRTVVVGTGAIDHNQFVREVEKNFAEMPSVNPIVFSGFVDYFGSSIQIRDDTVSEVNAFICFESVGWNHKHYWSNLVVQALIGSWHENSGGSIYLSSRLAEIVSKENLGTGFQSFYTAYRNTGLFGVYAIGHEDHFDDFTYEIFNEFQKLGAYIAPEELTRAKNKVKGALLSQIQTQGGLADDIGRQVLISGRHISVAELLARIDAVDDSDVHQCLDTYFRDVDPVVVAHGPIEHSPEYGIVRTWTYWNRW